MKEHYCYSGENIDIRSGPEKLQLNLLCDSFFGKASSLIDNCALALQGLQLVETAECSANENTVVSADGLVSETWSTENESLYMTTTTRKRMLKMDRKSYIRAFAYQLTKRTHKKHTAEKLTS